MELTDFKVLTFDCYGTLIDWEAGIAAVLAPWARRCGLDLDREQLLEAADALLFGEPDSERTVRWAEVLIGDLEASGRWSVETCAQLRKHLYGCGAPTGAS